MPERIVQMVAFIVLLVVFVMAMFMLALDNVGKRDWLVWVCLAVIGLIILLTGFGVVVVRTPI